MIDSREQSFVEIFLPIERKVSIYVNEGLRGFFVQKKIYTFSLRGY